MIKRFVLLFFVCLTVLLISSCSDSGTTSGVHEKALLTGTDCTGNGRGPCRTVSNTTTISTDTATSTSITTFTAYVQNYADLLAAYNASSRGQTIEAWGKWHYCNHGRNEGRMYTGTVNCSSTSTTTTTASSDETGSEFEGYVNKYGDLLAAYNASGGGQTKSAWGKNHYCNYGRNEGRTYSGLSAASCSSTATTITTSSTESCYGDYVRKYPDLLAAYNASGGGQSIETWGKSHYTNFGQSEGRTACNATSNTTTTTTTTASTDGLPVGDYQYLCKHNECLKTSNRTTRWASKSINVYSVYPALYSGLQSNWPAVNFNFGVRGGITLELGRGSWCGVAYPETWTDRTIRGCRVKVNIRVREKFCGTTASTVIHEVGHCLGFFEHTSDGGLMDAVANRSTRTNATVRNMISLLYSIPPGTDIGGRLRSYSRKGEDTYQSSNPQKEPTKAYYLKFRQ